ncbi:MULTISPECIES: hypothetical protein [Cyanobium]|uniref:Uncharacterized protein n=1 Tax=Cyanobium usitatum str. Tous TaxID=2116684 RepID=A0A2P7MZF6_9CYAN|nr:MULTISPECIES: hypothetical protein [Cyanobium]MCP9779357.1 hypothetical protein [Cyanobium sp. To12R1]PSJ06606.1 hypothetical protein C7K55_03945 [Cyanobium usitatum str. Tous]
MTQIPARADVPAGALELLGEKGGAERALTAALASFQEQVQAVSSLDLAAVVEAARPAFAQGIAFSSQLVDIRGRNKLRVTVMHACGAEVSSEEWADEVDDPLQASGWMLAMLLGIPLTKQALPVKPEANPATEPASAGARHPVLAAEASSSEASEACAAASGGDVALEPLTAQEIEATHQRILALPQAARRELTTAFREHFQVPRNARSIGDRITQHQHSAFIDRFLEEFEGAQTPVEP